MREITIEPTEAGRRLNKFLTRYLNVPDSFVYKQLRKKRIKLNGARASGSEILSAGDTLTLYLSIEPQASQSVNPIPAESLSQNMLDIVFEDENILIVDKPVGLLSQSAASGDDSISIRVSSYLLGSALLGSALLGSASLGSTRLESLESDPDQTTPDILGSEKYEPDKLEAAKLEPDQLEVAKLELAKLGVTKLESVLPEPIKTGSDRLSAAGIRAFAPGICNRLDRNTSGIILSGKNPRSVAWLDEAIRDRQIDKYYLVAVLGEAVQSTLRAYLRKDKKRNISVVSEHGQEKDRIITEIQPVERIGRVTLLCVRLVTGKPHQIRAHLKYVGLPVLGDPKYGDDQINELLKKHCITHQLLRANAIVFNKRDGFLSYLNGIRIEARPPTWLQSLREMYENGVL